MCVCVYVRSLLCLLSAGLYVCIVVVVCVVVRMFACLLVFRVRVVVC